MTFCTISNAQLSPTEAQLKTHLETLGSKGETTYNQSLNALCGPSWRSIGLLLARNSLSIVFLSLTLTTGLQAAMIVWVSTDKVFYSFSGSVAGDAGLGNPLGRQSDVFAPATASGTNPSFAATVGYNSTANTLVVGAAQTINNGTAAASQTGTADVTVRMTFQIQATSASDNGQLYDVYADSLLKGVLGTNLFTGSANFAEAYVAFTAPGFNGGSGIGFDQTYTSSQGGQPAPVSTWSIVDLRDQQRTVVTQPGGGFQTVTPTNSQINFDSGLFLLQPGQKVGSYITIQDSLSAYVKTSGQQTLAISDFYDPGQTSLHLLPAGAPLPEPATAGEVLLGATLIGLSRLSRSIFQKRTGMSYKQSFDLPVRGER